MQTRAERAEELAGVSDQRMRWGSETAEVEVAPYVVNGPPDQREFHETLLGLQEHHDPAAMEWAEYSRRLSLVASSSSGPTSQSLLERPRKTAVSWRGSYGPHGWHRYVGRFPPHLVRALLNHFGADAESVVCDPFLGSGTTLVECRLLGIPAIGIEISPLSALLARTKSKFPRSAAKLTGMLADLKEFYGESWAEFVAGRNIGTIAHSEVLARQGNVVPAFPNHERWLTSEALLGVSLVAEFTTSLRGYARSALLIALSAKMRSIGNVDVDVVRAEYRKRPRENVDVLKLVDSAVKKMARDIGDAHGSHPAIDGAASILVIEGDALSTLRQVEQMDYIITSPPYGVESLSYLRTHLLSFRCLNRFLATDPYTYSDAVVGSEYLPTQDPDPDAYVEAADSRSYRKFFAGELPAAEDVRLRTRTAMTMKFFTDMARFGEEAAAGLRASGRLAFVIGNKRLGDRIIPTHDIIVELFEARGLRHDRSIRHKLKTNNSNSQVPWQERIIQDEFVMLFTKH